MYSLFVLDHKEGLLNSWFSNQMERLTSLAGDQRTICTQRISDNYCGLGTWGFLGQDTAAGSACTMWWCLMLRSEVPCRRTYATSLHFLGKRVILSYAYIEKVSSVSEESWRSWSKAWQLWPLLCAVWWGRWPVGACMTSWLSMLPLTTPRASVSANVLSCAFWKILRFVHKGGKCSSSLLVLLCLMTAIWGAGAITLIGNL